MRGAVHKLPGNKDKNQRGVASILVVAIVILLLTIISIGFARIMSRSTNTSLNGQLGSSASYAVQSALNDTVTYLKSHPATPTASTCNSSTLQTIYTGGNLSGNGNTQYTCILINPKPGDLVYQNLPALGSQVIKMTTDNTVDSAMFSWQAHDTSKSSLPAAGASSLLDETTWSSSNYAPMLRLTLYPVPSSGSLAGTQSGSRTYFLYPNSGSAGTIGSISYSATADGSLVKVNCLAKTLPSSFSGTDVYTCNAIISGLSSVIGAGGYFYVRLTPIYVDTDLKIKAVDSTGATVHFINVQAIVDVTAKANSAAKRLQARVDTGTENISPTDNAIPENTLRSAEALCKRLNITSTGVASVDASASSICNLSIVQPSPPTVQLCINTATNCPKTISITSGISITLLWSSTNSSSCSATIPAGWTSSTLTSGSQSVSPTATTTYTITCTAVSGSTAQDSVTVTVVTPPPPPTDGGTNPSGGGPYCEVFSYPNDWGDCPGTYDGGHWNDYAATCDNGSAGVVHTLIGTSDDGTITLSECIPGSSIINTDCGQGYTRDSSGHCVPDYSQCGYGNILVNGVCVQNFKCPSGYSGYPDYSQNANPDGSPFGCYPSNSTNPGNAGGPGPSGGGSVTCWDNSSAPDVGSCPSHSCWDGSTTTDVCPPVPPANCWDGNYYPNPGDCPPEPICNPICAVFAPPKPGNDYLSLFALNFNLGLR